MPKVSVIIPAFNAMAYLPETVGSVLQQTFTDYEVLIVNDGSSDDIEEWVAQTPDPRVKLISQSNQGVSVARNTGFAQAQGEYIAFLDADDLWEPTKLEKQVRCLDDDPEVGLVYTWTVLVDQQGKPTGITYTYDLEGDVWETVLVEDIVCSGSSAIVRRCCFDRVGGFDPNLSSAADGDMWVRIAANYRFAVIKEFLVYYRQTTNSMSKNREKMLRDLRLTIEKRFQTAPLELLYLRCRAYAHMNRWQAWVAVYAGDYQSATHFHQQAFLHHPELRYSKNSFHLSCRILLVRYLGFKAYAKLRELKQRIRSIKQLVVANG